LAVPQTAFFAINGPPLLLMLHLFAVLWWSW